MPTPQRNSYSFKEGLTMMAARAIGVDPYLAAEGGENARAAINAIRNAAKTKAPKERASFIRDAQNELRSISAAQHPKLVNALQAKLLALQGRGGDTHVAHLTPGEMVIPRAMLTPEVMRMIAAEAQRRGIDPSKLVVGKGSINPATGEEEFSIVDTIRGWFGGSNKEPELDMSGVGPVSVTRRDPRIEMLEPNSIPVTTRMPSIYGPDRILNPSGGSERNDKAGKGWFGAVRDGHEHQGVDITVGEDNQPILSPIEGKVLRRSNIYPAKDIKDHPEWAGYRSVVVEGTGPNQGLTAKLFYVDGEGPKPGDSVSQGQVLGRSQNRQKAGPDGMLNHVHLETIWNGEKVDPAGFLPRWQTKGPKRW